MGIFGKLKESAKTRFKEVGQDFARGEKLRRLERETKYKEQLRTTEQVAKQKVALMNKRSLEKEKYKTQAAAKQTKFRLKNVATGSAGSYFSGMSNALVGGGGSSTPTQKYRRVKVKKGKKTTYRKVPVRTTGSSSGGGGFGGLRPGDLI